MQGLGISGMVSQELLIVLTGNFVATAIFPKLYLLNQNGGFEHGYCIPCPKSKNFRPTITITNTYPTCKFIDIELGIHIQ